MFGGGILHSTCCLFQRECDWIWNSIYFTELVFIFICWEIALLATLNVCVTSHLWEMISKTSQNTWVTVFAEVVTATAMKWLYFAHFHHLILQFLELSFVPRVTPQTCIYFRSTKFNNYKEKFFLKKNKFECFLIDQIHGSSLMGGVNDSWMSQLLFLVDRFSISSALQRLLDNYWENMSSFDETKIELFRYILSTMCVAKRNTKIKTLTQQWKMVEGTLWFGPSSLYQGSISWMRRPYGLLSDPFFTKQFKHIVLIYDCDLDKKQIWF